MREVACGAEAEAYGVVLYSWAQGSRAIVQGVPSLRVLQQRGRAPRLGGRPATCAWLSRVWRWRAC